MYLWEGGRSTPIAKLWEEERDGGGYGWGLGSGVGVGRGKEGERRYFRRYKTK